MDNSMRELDNSVLESAASSDTNSVVCFTLSTSSAADDELSQAYSYSLHPSWCSWWSAPDPLDHCPCCPPLPLDYHIAEAQEASRFPSSHYKTSEHRYFRALSRSQQRARKIRENKGGCNSYRCRRSGRAQQDIMNLKKKREGLKWAVRESQKEVLCYTADSRHRMKHCLLEWDTEVEEIHEEVSDLVDGGVRCFTIHDDAETVVNEEIHLAGSNFRDAVSMSDCGIMSSQGKEDF
ncbi:hypothetical protein CC80DRAFT_579291 [Byssothecium circinans]|uniref:Uncharacterized protein n=1 Tax=Byssothecium circinans TaxID=147558 RepID=A0A6A5TA39_9PLEO|nr:hypothetical protein CC80DRAFT_579291 [Byssothecium circinans]